MKGQNRDIKKHRESNQRIIQMEKVRLMKYLFFFIFCIKDGQREEERLQNYPHEITRNLLSYNALQFTIGISFALSYKLWGLVYWEENPKTHVLSIRLFVSQEVYLRDKISERELTLNKRGKTFAFTLTRISDIVKNRKK